MNILIEIVVQVYHGNIIEYLSEDQEKGRECTMHQCWRYRRAAGNSLQGALSLTLDDELKSIITHED
jgi:hypothetical protein